LRWLVPGVSACGGIAKTSAPVATAQSQPAAAPATAVPATAAPNPSNSLTGPVGAVYTVTDASGNEMSVMLTRVIGPAQVSFTLTSANPDSTVETYQGADTVTAGKIVAANVVQGVLGTVSAAASASSAPVVQANTNGWTGMSVRPRHIYIGQGGSPYVSRRRNWTVWGPYTASPSGRLHEISPSCPPPIYLCQYNSRHVRVYLHRVQADDGFRYFTRMRWTLRNGHRIHWRLNRALGGTVLAWN